MTGRTETEAMTHRLDLLPTVPLRPGLAGRREHRGVDPELVGLLHRRPELRDLAHLAVVLDEQVRWSA